MNKIIENKDNDSQGSNNTLTSNSDTQDFISSDEEIKSGAHQKFNNEFLGCNVNDNNKREKKTRKRPSKAERFIEERKKFLKELEKMMGLTEETRGVLLYDLEHNEELKEYLKNKIPEIRKLHPRNYITYVI
jgi:hypothetical protein